MKKFSVVLLILSISLLTSGCMNKFAVQSLNAKAQKYMNEGKTEEAISRLEASIDLDDTVYETYYNLAVAYMDVDKTDKAQEALNKVLELNPDFADAYYIMAVIYEDNAYSIINGKNVKQNEIIENNGTPVKKELSSNDKAEICLNLDSAIKYYEKYLKKQQNASDVGKVNAKTAQLNSELQKYGKSESKEKSN